MTTTTLPNTGAIVPVPQQRRGPAYASDLVTAFENYDEHDHTTGKGKPIGVSAIDIDGDLDFKALDGHHINNAGAVNMRSATNSILSLSLYTDGENLFWKDGQGDNIQITLLGNVNESASGSITGLTESAGVTYTPGSLYYTFLNEIGNHASIQQGTPTFFKLDDTMASKSISLDFDANNVDGSPIITLPNSSGELLVNGLTELDFTHSTAPGSVVNNHSKIFFDAADNLPKFQNESGVVTTFGAGGAAENAKTANFATGGDLDTISTDSFLSTGAGTFSVETAAPIRGNESAHYAGYASSSNLTYLTDIPIPRGYRNSTVRVSFKYTGGGNIKLEIVDRTGDTDGSIVNPNTLDIPQSFQDSPTAVVVYNDLIADIFIPNTVEKVRLRWVGTGDIPQTDMGVDIPFIFDDIVVTPIGEATLPVTTYTYPTPTADNTNEFSARLDNTDGDGAVTILSEDVSFIKSATKTATGQITIVFNDDMFSDIPLVITVPVAPDGTYDNINSDGTQVSDVTATGFDVGYLHQGGGMGGEAHVFRNQGQINITVIRQGSDVKTKELVKETRGTIVSYEQSINQYDPIWFEADISVVSGAITLSNLTRNGVESAWMTANSNSNSGVGDFLYDTSITNFTVPAIVTFEQAAPASATQYFQEGNSATQFTLHGRSIVNGSTSQITTSGKIIVRPGYADAAKFTSLPTGAYILARTKEWFEVEQEGPAAGADSVTFNWVVPEGIEECYLTAAAPGAGGGGGGTEGTGGQTGSGGGGGGAGAGIFEILLDDLVEGETVTFEIPSPGDGASAGAIPGGSSGSGGNNASDVGDMTITATNHVFVLSGGDGGHGGNGASNNNDGSGGTAGILTYNTRSVPTITSNGAAGRNSASSASTWFDVTDRILSLGTTDITIGGGSAGSTPGGVHMGGGGGGGGSTMFAQGGNGGDGSSGAAGSDGGGGGGAGYGAGVNGVNAPDNRQAGAGGAGGAGGFRLRYFAFNEEQIN